MARDGSRWTRLARRAGLAAAAALLACGQSPQGRPNLVLVSLDTVRADHCSVYAYARDTTPHLRALAETGIRFERAYAHSSMTMPSAFQS